MPDWSGQELVLGELHSTPWGGRSSAQQHQRGDSWLGFVWKNFVKDFITFRRYMHAAQDLYEILRPSYNHPPLRSSHRHKENKIF